MKTRAFYFGCFRQPGHYLWRGPEDDHGYMPTGRDHGLPFHPERMDAALAPRNASGGEVHQGLASYGLLNGWTIISFWDNSIDRRPGSSSTFFIEGAHYFEEALEIAREDFPKVFARLGFEVKPFWIPDHRPPLSDPALAFIEAQLNLLRKQEWTGGPNSFDPEFGPRGHTCPVCKGCKEHDGHRKDCKLATSIASAEAALA